MKFKETAFHLKPKRSPIFWGLIALVLVFITPPMLMMLGGSFQLFVSALEALIKGESSPLNGILPLIMSGLIVTLSSVLFFAAMLCLIFKKYRTASKLIVAAPLCFIVGVFALLLSFNFIDPLSADDLANLTPDFSLVNFALLAQKLLIPTILFLYARKYLRLENAPTTA